jgi:hypothetical protein
MWTPRFVIRLCLNTIQNEVIASGVSRCHCGKPLGTDEQLSLELDNGSIRASSMLA